MIKVLAAALLPPMFVFGVYHLLTWVNALRIKQRVFWRRVALASAISHAILVTGFLAFLYSDFQARQGFGESSSLSVFVFNRSEFWRVLTIFDTAPLLVIVALFWVMDRTGLNPPGLLAITFVITYAVGTLQWFLIGGGAGAIVERFWEGLKTPEDEEGEWF